MLKRLLRGGFRRLGYEIVRAGPTQRAVLEGRVFPVCHGAETYRFFVVHPEDWIQLHHVAGRLHEPEELTAIAAAVTGPGLFLDVGANVGNHAVFVARHFPDMRILAVEPGALQRDILAINLALNGVAARVEVSPVALSNRAGEARLLRPSPVNLGGSALDLAGRGPGETIPLQRGDDLVGARRTGFIKIDVEGHEISVLAGLRGTISRDRPVILAEIATPNAAALDAWLGAADYEIAAEVTAVPEFRNLLLRPKPG